MAKCKKCGKTVSTSEVRYLGDSKNAYHDSCLEAELAKLAEPDKVVVACPMQSAEDYDPSYDDALKLFDINTMTYSEGQKLQRQKDPSVKGAQLEHPIPNSCFMQNAGRKGTVVNGGGNYTEGSAIVFPVGDDQRAGTEHKFLTNQERALAKKLETSGKYATPNQWLQAMVPAWERTFVKFRSKTYATRKRIKDAKSGKLRHPTPKEVKQMIRADARRAARALANKQRRSLSKQKVLTNARLKNGLAGRSAKAPAKKLPKSQQFMDF